MKKLFLTIITLILLPLASLAQITVEGNVKDEFNDPIPGLNVYVKDTTLGTITDLHGNYSLANVPSNSILVFSSIGLITEEVQVEGRTSIDMVIYEDISRLDEVIVIGYGTVRKRDLTGSVASVSAEEIERVPTFSPLEAIQGHVPGMDITKSSGQAGSGVDILIRGNRSIHGSNSPLFIIDGIQGGSYSDLNPNDIASIEVLKDASSTAIYGSQGANGVVIITTKQGKEGKTKVSYDGYIGLNGYADYPKPRIGDDYIQLRRDAYQTSGFWDGPGDDSGLFSDREWNAVQNGLWVDWVDELMQTGIQESHTVSVAGGSERSTSFISFSYFNEEGMIPNDQATRYTVRTNLDYKVNDWINTGIRTQVAYWEIDRRNDNALSKAATALPLGVPYDEEGNINRFPLEGYSTFRSPLTDDRPSTTENNTIRVNTNLNGYVELTPFEGFSARSNVGATLRYNRQGIYNDATSIRQENSNINEASVSSSNTRFFTWDNILTYRRMINRHRFTVTAFSSYTNSETDNVYALGVNQLLAAQSFYNLAASDAESRSISSGYVMTRTFSLGGRIEYAYDDRYLLTISNRWDGASRLAPGNKWASFPSIAGAWNINEEIFMDDLPTISQLKLRVSWGVSGNSGIDPYGTQSLIHNVPFGFQEIGSPAYNFSNRVGNASLGWEESATINYGLDIGVLNNRLSANVDVYSTKTTNILQLRGLASSSGVIETYQNIGETENKGVELSIRSRNIQTKNFKWTTNLSFTSNREKITALVDNQDLIRNERDVLLIGYPIDSYYTYKTDGIWQLGEEEEAAKYSVGGTPFKPGDIKVLSLSDGYEISPEEDRSYIGDSTPDWFAGMQNIIAYKNFDLNVYMFARWGQTVYAEFVGRYNPGGDMNGPSFIDYWTPDNPSNDFPRPERGKRLFDYPGYQALSFVDGSFFKIKTVSLGYTLPKSLTQRAYIDRVRFYVTANNLFTFANSHLMKHYDPERGGSETSPLTKQYVFGLNIDF